MKILITQWILITHENITTEKIIIKKIIIIKIIIIKIINYFLKKDIFIKKEILTKNQIIVIDLITNIVKFVKETVILQENADIIHETQREYSINIIKMI